MWPFKKPHVALFLCLKFSCKGLMELQVITEKRLFTHQFMNFSRFDMLDYILKILIEHLFGCWGKKNSETKVNGRTILWRVFLDTLVNCEFCFVNVQSVHHCAHAVFFYASWGCSILLEITSQEALGFAWGLVLLYHKIVSFLAFVLISNSY